MLKELNKTIDDFRDEDGICSYEFGNYLVDETDSMLTGGEVKDKLNNYEERIKELETRNNRQKESLEEIWDLILNRDWRILEQKAIKLEEAEEVLKNEFGGCI